MAIGTLVLATSVNNPWWTQAERGLVTDEFVDQTPSKYVEGVSPSRGQEILWKAGYTHVIRRGGNLIIGLHCSGARCSNAQYAAPLAADVLRAVLALEEERRNRR